MEAQLLWLSDLARETDLAVPEPVPLPDGSLVGRVSFDDLPPLRALLRRQIGPATADLPSGPPAAALRAPELGARKDQGRPERRRILAGRPPGGGAARPRQPLPTSRRPRVSPLGLELAFRASAPVWEGGEAFYSADEMNVFEAVARRVRGELDGFGYGSGVFGTIHRDLTLTNLLFGGGVDQGAAGATDFDQFGLGHYLFDLPVVLRALRPRWRRAGRHFRADGRAGPGGALRGLRERAGPSRGRRTLPRRLRRHAEGGRRQQGTVTGRPARVRERGCTFLRHTAARLERNYLQ